MQTRASFGIQGLDHILGGGLPVRKLYLVQGDPGSGKTTMALQFLMEGARRGEPVLYITLSESKDDLNGIADSHGWDMRGITIHEVKTQSDDPREGEEYTVFHPGEVELSDLMKDFFTEAERISPKRVVIDSMSEMRLLARDPLKFRRHLLAIRQFFTARDCTIVLLDAARAKADDLQANTLPHGVITIEHFSPAFGARRRRLIITKLRGVKFDDGYHDLKIETGGVVVFPRLTAPDNQGAFERKGISSNIAELDRLTNGGLDRGTSTVIMGSAGTGKSTLASQYVAAAASRGERSAIFTFDENIQTLLDRSAGLGMNLGESFKNGLVHIQQIDPGEMSPGEFAQCVRDQVEQNDVRIVVVDSLNGYMQATPDERFLMVQLHEILGYLAGQGVVTILIVAQHGIISSQIDTVVDVSYLADTVFLLRYFEAVGAVRKCISVLKNRTGPHELTIREVSVGQGGIKVGLPLTGFNGVLTGVPTLAGAASLLNQGGADGSAVAGPR